MAAIVVTLRLDLCRGQLSGKSASAGVESLVHQALHLSHFVIGGAALLGRLLAQQYAVGRPRCEPKTGSPAVQPPDMLRIAAGQVCASFDVSGNGLMGCFFRRARTFLVATNFRSS